MVWRQAIGGVVVPIDRRWLHVRLNLTHTLSPLHAPLTPLMTPFLVPIDRAERRQLHVAQVAAVLGVDAHAIRRRLRVDGVEPAGDACDGLQRVLALRYERLPLSRGRQ